MEKTVTENKKESHGKTGAEWDRMKKRGGGSMEEKKAYIRQMLEEMEEREIDMVYYMMRGMEKAKRNKR
jgi:hypothetical protein